MASRLLSLAGILLLCLVCGRAQACDRCFYVGVDGGFSTLEDDGMGLRQDLDDDSGNISLHGGYQWKPWLAGQVNIDFMGAYEGEIPTADFYSSYSALTLSLVPRLPLGSGVSLYGEVGGGLGYLYQWVDGVVGSFYFDDEAEVNSYWLSFWALGVAYQVPQHPEFDVHLGYRQYRFETDAYAVGGSGNLYEGEFDQEIEQVYLGVTYYLP